ncbi:MAG: D-alanyl-D-alanine carboxypeptidase, partial [Acidimicrobiia bacterium]
GLGALFDGLSVAGKSGTLFDQLLGTALIGVLRGKTGSLDGVSGLTGVVASGQTLRFAYLDNGDFPVTRAYSFFRPVAEIIGRFPDAPPVDALVPAPK